jgi:hypothetical protein
MSVSGDSRAPGDEQRRENPPWNKDSKHSQERPPNPRLRAPGKVSFQVLGGRAGVPAVAFAGTLDQLASRPCRSGCFLASRRAACSDASPSRRCASARIGDPRGGQERRGRDLHGRGVAKALGLAGHVPGTEERRVPVGDDVHGGGHRRAVSSERRQLYVLRPRTRVQSTPVPGQDLVFPPCAASSSWLP